MPIDKSMTVGQIIQKEMDAERPRDQAIAMRVKRGEKKKKHEQRYGKHGSSR